MTDAQRRRMDMFQREAVFMTDNAADFPAASPGATTAAALNAVIGEIETLDANFTSGADDFNRNIELQDNAEDELYENLRLINLGAKALSDTVPELAAKFRLPYPRSQQSILATARSFATEAVPYEAQFVEYGLPANFITELNADIAKFEAALDASDSAESERAGAVGGLTDAFKRGMDINRRLSAIVKIKYRDDPKKLASWLVASHLERPPKSDKPPTP